MGFIAPSLMQLDHLASEIGIFQPVTKDIQHVGCLSPHPQHHAGGKAGKLLRAQRGIPTDDDAVTRLPGRRMVVEAKPFPFDEVAAVDNGLLLILGAEIQ